MDVNDIILTHEKHGPVIYNCNTGMFRYIEYTPAKNFEYLGKQSVFFDSVADFIKSGYSVAVVPFTCTKGVEHIGRRTKVTLLDKDYSTFEFFNVETINSKWVTNVISDIVKGESYFAIIAASQLAMNDILLLKTISIKEATRNKNMQP